MEDTVSVARPCANFHPSVWGDFFLQYASDTMETFTEEQELKRLKEEVRMMFKDTPDESLSKLELIDNIQRLGVAYQFEEEIKASLLHIYTSYEESVLNEAHDDLHTIALRFRLLRQHGCHVSAEAFSRFLDTEGKFKPSLATDVKGMLSLFEAANYRVHQENILDEALSFTTENLDSIAKCSNDFLANKINEALKMPFQKTLTRLGARGYISHYEQDKPHDELVLKFAKLDFNKLQRLHQKELGVLTLWYKELDWATTFYFARDRSAECYFWILAVYHEPQYCLGRKFLAKVIIMISLMDDTYDAYGTIDELLLLTDAIQRWNIDATNQLPTYPLKRFYKVLLDVFTEMEEDLSPKGWSERVQYIIAEMKKLSRAFYQEAYWRHRKYVPTIEEYMKTAVVTGAYLALATCSYMGMGDVVTKEVLDWAATEPLMVRAASTISRLMDDVVGHEIVMSLPSPDLLMRKLGVTLMQSKLRCLNLLCISVTPNFRIRRSGLFEQKREHVATAVECYMKQHGASKQEAIQELEKWITNAWKDLNQECLHPTAAPLVILERVFNFARVIHVLYRGDDSYTHSTNNTRQFITSVLVDPITI